MGRTRRSREQLLDAGDISARSGVNLAFLRVELAINEGIELLAKTQNDSNGLRVIVATIERPCLFQHAGGDRVLGPPNPDRHDGV